MKPTPKPVCRTLAAALALALTAGCTIRPEPLSDDEHRARVAEDRKAIASEFVPVSAPLTLPEAIARALKYNYENRLALMESVLQDRQLSVANFAMLPRLAVNAGYSARDNDLASVSQDVYPERHPRENNYQTSNDRAHHFADLTFTWNLLDFGVGYYQARQQADRVLVARERRRKVVNNIVKEVTAAYWRAATAERLLPQVRPVLARAEQALRASRSIEQDQLQPLIPTLEYRRNLLQVVGQLRKLAADLEVSKAQLAGLINVPAGAPLPIAVPSRSEALPGAMQASLEQLETVGLHYRPDLREEAYQARIDRLGVRKEMIRLLPGLSLLGSTSYDSNSYLLNRTWAEAGVRATWNLVNLAAGPSTIDAAEAQVEVDLWRRRALSIAAIVQINVAWQQYRRALDGYDSADALNDIEGKLLRAVANAETAEAQSGFDRIRRELSALSAQLDRDRALAELYAALANVYVSVGIDPYDGPIDGVELPEMTRTVAANLALWRAGRLPEAALKAATEAAAPPAAPATADQPVPVPVPATAPKLADTGASR
ncbi:MAG TPA: TolC family protein [Plasticicumulans sp.]|uniref:TolC family protein n=1 Tax=Plasticicumulans sp. TaxID=2307179 RepID=UPI002CAD969D|nr:TolC family protein [Plasticicumulans sp.]HMW31328.1 TolC family protein [Plasticicumulans sp.]